MLCSDRLVQQASDDLAELGLAGELGFSKHDNANGAKRARSIVVSTVIVALEACIAG